MQSWPKVQGRQGDSQSNDKCYFRTFFWHHEDNAQINLDNHPQTTNKFDVGFHKFNMSYYFIDAKVQVVHSF